MSEESVRRELDRYDWGPFFNRLWFICGLGWMFDSMNIAALGLVLPVIIPLFHLSRTVGGVIASVTYVGFMIGAFATGVLSDRIGRRTMMMIDILVFSLGALLAGLAQSYLWLLVARFIGGLGMGGEFPIISAYLSETTPRRRLNRVTGLTSAFYSYGFALTPLIALFVVPALQWRGLFLALVIPALLTVWMRMALPESPLFLARKGRLEELDVAMKTITANARVATAEGREPDTQAGRPLTAGWVAYLVAVWVLTFFAQYGFVTWVPSVVNLKAPALAGTYGFTAVLFSGMIVGYLLAAFWGDRLPVKWFLIAAFVEFGVSLFLFGVAPSLVTMLAAGWFAAAGYGFTTIATYVYTPLQFRPEVRGSGVGMVTGIGRIGAIVGPTVVGLLSPVGGFGLSFSAFAAGCAVVALLVLLVDRLPAAAVGKGIAQGAVS